MNKKGFTLVELLAVLVLIILIMLLVIPNLKNLFSSNSKKQYESYEDMMVEYTKTYPNYEDYEHICLEDLGIDKFNKNISCNGFVRIHDSKINPYLYCVNDENEDLYKTDGYDKDTAACFGIIDNSLKVIATINNTDTIYKSGTWINGKDYVTLMYKTLSNLENINVLKGENIIDSCELVSNGILYNCDISIHESGTYDSYGIFEEEKIYSESINILIDKNTPTFDIYDNKNNLLNNNANYIVMEIESETIDFNNIVKNINDSESGIKSIRYSFEKEDSGLNFINVSVTDSFTISKTIGIGNYKLVVEVIDNVENKTEKVINYQINEKRPDTVLYTVIHKQMDNDGINYNVIREENFYDVVGKIVSPAVDTYDNFVSPSTQTFTLTANPETNIITYLYERICFGEKCNQCIKGSKIGTCMYEKRVELGLYESGLSKDVNNQNVRFVGTKSNEPNNWVCFGTKDKCTDTNHLYRMIGVFSTEHRVRLIIGKRLGSVPWKNSSYTGSSLMKYTHSDIKDDVDAILTSSTYGFKTLINDTSKWSDIIVKTKRDSFADDDNALPNYSANKFLNRDYRNGDRSYSAKLHLTSTADMLLSSGTTSLKFASNPYTINKSWMYAGAEWTYQIYNTGYVYIINTVGRICGNGTSKCSISADLSKNNKHMYRITFDLDYKTLFCGGSGTKVDPIILGYGSCTN